MKKRALSLFLALVLCLGLAAPALAATIVVKPDQPTGWTVKEVVPCKYDDAYWFSEGLAAVCADGKWGFIDAAGREVIPPRYDGVKDGGFDGTPGFCYGLAAVYTRDENEFYTGKWGFVDTTGKEAVPCIYDEVGNFAECGLAAVCRDGKWGYVDTTGKEVIPCQYYSVSYFREGLAFVSTGDLWTHKGGYIDTTGRAITPFQYDFASSFSGGYAWVIREDGFGYIDATGKEIVPCKYDNPVDAAAWYDYTFFDGLAPVCLNDKWGFVDTTGREVIPLQYDGVLDVVGDIPGFSEGLAAVRVGDYETGKWGFIDTTGKEVVPPQYDRVSAFFAEGVAAVFIGDSYPNGKWGLIDKTGKEVVPCRYDWATPISEDRALAELDGTYSLIDIASQEAHPLAYDTVRDYVADGLVPVGRDGKWGVIDTAGQEAVPCQYDEVDNIAEGMVAVRMGDYATGKWGFLSVAQESDPPTPDTYTVTVAAAQHGKVTATPASGEAGTKVTLTVTPDRGYELDTLTVKQASGTAVKVTNNTFTMPASNVTVSATFKELSSEEPGKGEMRQSGGKGIAKLTREEIVALLNENPSDTPKDVFVTAPNCTAPYEIGEVKWEVLERVTNRLNALRTLAGLPKVTLDKQLCEDAQYGAVILGKLGYLSHYPDQPEDMDQAFYQRASAATSSSNIYAGMSLCATPDGFMDDSDESNIERVGHRRWQLNPAMGKVGFGYAETNSGYHRYTTEKVFDESGEDFDYDFVGWPASGDFPIGAFFGSDTAWSVTVNPKKYQTPSAEKITVHLTREGDGASWTFSTLGYSDAGYFNVETSNRGVNNCVIFRPDLSGDRDLVGETYTVTIDGLKTIGGTSVDDFSYQVSFFDPKQTVTPGTGGSTGGSGGSTGGGGSSGGGSTSTTPTNPEPTIPTTPASQTFGDVEKGSWYESGVTFVVSKGLFNGVGDGAFAPQQNMTRAMLMTVLARLAGQSTDGGETWYAKGMDWATAQGISDGTDPEGNITREQLVTMLYRYAQSPAATGGLDNFADAASISDWAADAMRWAVQNGILTGKDGARLDPQGLATRAEVAIILQRYVEK